MFDFCFTFPYAALLAFGGVAGFLAKGSIPSLLGGCGSAAILFVAANSSLKAYQKQATCRPATAMSLAIALCLSVVMGLRYYRTGKVMPAGALAVLSGGMSLFYVWNMLNADQLLKSVAKPSKQWARWLSAPCPLWAMGHLQDPQCKCLPGSKGGDRRAGEGGDCC